MTHPLTKTTRAAEELAKSVLAPRKGEPHPWLMPAMAASRCAAHDPFGVEMPTLYPRRIVWVDFDNGDDDGDGSRAKPLKTLDRVFDDPLLACVCDHLGADRIPVCCRGTLQEDHAHTIAPTPDGSSAVVYDHALIKPATPHDYRRHLEIMPWPGQPHPVFKLKLKATLNRKMEDAMHAASLLAIVRDVRGVYWNKCDFVFEIYMGCEVDEQTLTLYAQLYGFDRCPGTAARDCTMKITRAKIAGHVEEKEGEEKEGSDELVWPGTGGDYYYDGEEASGSCGGYGGYGGYGGEYDDSYFTLPGGGDGGWYHPQQPPHCPRDTYMRIIHFSNCANAFVAGGFGSWENNAASNRSAGVYSAAFDNCPGLVARDYALDIPRTRARVSGGGGKWKDDNTGAHGVADFSLVAEARARIAYACNDAQLLNVTGTLGTDATCHATNTPCTTDKNGNTTTRGVGGYAEATTIAYPAKATRKDCPEPALDANAFHPSGRVYITREMVDRRTL